MHPALHQGCQMIAALIANFLQDFWAEIKLWSKASSLLNLESLVS
jgi:hypothetical protein